MEGHLRCSPKDSDQQLKRLDDDALNLDEELLDLELGPDSTLTARSLCVSLASAATIEATERSGFLVKKSGAFSGHRRRFFVLREGTLLWYLQPTDARPQGFVHLVLCAILDGAELPSRRHGYSFTIRARKDYLLFADDERERTAWLRALRHNACLQPLGLDGLCCDGAEGANGADCSGKSLDEGSGSADGAVADGAAVDGVAAGSTHRAANGVSGEGNAAQVGTEARQGSKAPRRSGKGVRMGGLAFRAEDYLISRAVTSELGKRMLREYCIPETFVLLDALRGLASKDPCLPPKTGQQMENTILRVAFKLTLLFQHRVLTPRHFDQLNANADSLCIDFVRKCDALITPPHEDAYDPDHSQLCAQIGKLEEELVHLVGPRTSPRQAALIRTATRYFGDPTNAARLLSDPTFAPDLRRLADTLRRMYALEDLSADGFRRAVRAEGNTFKVGSVGLAPGTAVLCKMPCCGAVVRLIVPKRTKSLIFPMPQYCLEHCEPHLIDGDEPPQEAPPVERPPIPPLDLNSS